jgi:hypothetical protein
MTLQHVMVAGDETPPAPIPGKDTNVAYQRYREVEELMEFAAEKGKLEPLDLAIRIKDLKQPFVQKNQTPAQEAELEKIYAELALLIVPVTSDTFRATSEKYRIERPWWRAWLLGSHSRGRNFFRQLTWVGIGLVLIMVYKEHVNIQATLHPEVLADPLEYPEWFIAWKWFIVWKIFAYLEPFLYGALGALVYLYKTLHGYYNERIFDPKKIATDWFRLFMGAIAGGMVVLFIQSIPDETGKTVQVATAALGFLAGYSVEFFYQTLDRIIQAILPKVGISTLRPEAQALTARQQHLETLTKRLLEATDDKDKETLRKLLEKQTA